MCIERSVLYKFCLFLLFLISHFARLLFGRRLMWIYLLSHVHVGWCQNTFDIFCQVVKSSVYFSSFSARQQYTSVCTEGNLNIKWKERDKEIKCIENRDADTKFRRTEGLHENLKRKSKQERNNRKMSDRVKNLMKWYTDCWSQFCFLYSSLHLVCMCRLYLNFYRHILLFDWFGFILSHNQSMVSSMLLFFFSSFRS